MNHPERAILDNNGLDRGKSQKGGAMTWDRFCSVLFRESASRLLLPDVEDIHVCVQVDAGHVKLHSNVCSPVRGIIAIVECDRHIAVFHLPCPDLSGSVTCKSDAHLTKWILRDCD